MHFTNFLHKIMTLPSTTNFSSSNTLDVTSKACTYCHVSLLHCSYNVSFLHTSIFTVSFTPPESSSSHILFCRLLTTRVPSNASIFSTPSLSAYTFQTPHHILCLYTFPPHQTIFFIFTFSLHFRIFSTHCPSTLDSPL